MALKIEGKLVLRKEREQTINISGFVRAFLIELIFWILPPSS